MERFDIEQAFKLRQEVYDKLNVILIEVEKDFVILNKHNHLDVRFIIYPVHYGNTLFEIGLEMNNFFRNEIPKTPKYDSFLIWNPEQYSEVPFRQDDYFFKSNKEDNLAACLIRTDGIMIYNIHFELYTEYYITDLLERCEVFEDPLERIRGGIVFDERIFPQEYVVDYFLGLLDFLHIFYTKLNYFGDIHLTLKINTLGSWVESIHKKSFRPRRLNPINIDFNVELIPEKKMEIVKETFNPIFNGFGLLEGDLREFYALFEG